MGLEYLLNKEGIGPLSCLTKHKEKASQILRAVEGMSIWEARELLQACSSVLERTKIEKLFGRPKLLCFFKNSLSYDD